MREIKKVGVESTDIIQQLSYEIWPHTYTNILPQGQVNYMLDLLYSKNALHDLIVNQQQQFIIAYKNFSPIGFASYSVKSPGDISIYRLHKLYVLPGQQSRGSGRQMLEYIIAVIVLGITGFLK